MPSKLVTNVKNNLILYKRSRLLNILGIILLVFYGLTSIPYFITASFTAKVSGIARILNNLHTLSVLFLVIALLVGLYYPVKNRCLKMIITKPCKPETWLLSNYISSIIIALMINLLIFIIASVFFLIWGMGFQMSLVYVFFDQAFQLVLLLSYLTFLMLVFNVWGAIIFGLILTESFFFYLTNMFTALHNSASNAAGKFLYLIIQKFFYTIYMILPMSSPFSKETNFIYRNFRVESSDWKYLLYTLLYTLSIAGFFYLVNNCILKKKRLI